MKQISHLSATCANHVKARARASRLFKLWLSATLDVPLWVTVAGILAILAVGIVHIVAMPGSWSEEMCGEALMFAFDAVGALFAVVGISRRLLAGWTLGVLVSGGALFGFLMSRTIGLPAMLMMMKQMPGMMREEWVEPLALIAVAAEIVFVAVLVWALHTHHVRFSANAPQKPSRFSVERFAVGQVQRRFLNFPMAAWSLLVVTALTAGGSARCSAHGNYATAKSPSETSILEAQKASSSASMKGMGNRPGMAGMEEM